MTRETIQKCIDLLNTDGINSKEQVKKILQGELEAIDNSNPSEALECLEKLELLTCDFEWYKDNITTIKQALLKAQYYNSNNFKDSKEVKIEIPEQELMDYNPVKQYLKWEDLNFKEVSQLDHKIIKAKLNGQLYELDLYRYGGYKRVEIRAVGKSYNYNCEGYVICIDEEFPETIQFFNDLHLERVEE